MRCWEILMLFQNFDFRFSNEGVWLPHCSNCQQTFQDVVLKALAHYNWNCKKSSYRPYTLQLFFTTATIFSTVLYMGNNFYNNFFWKIFVKIFVVCEGLNEVMRCFLNHIMAIELWNETFFAAIFNVRPAFFYTKALIFNSVASCLIMTKVLHPTI